MSDGKGISSWYRDGTFHVEIYFLLSGHKSGQSVRALAVSLNNFNSK